MLSVLSELERDRTSSTSSSPRTPDDSVAVETVTAEEVERRERRRKKITEELFETEKTYLQHLDLTHRVCASLDLIINYLLRCTLHWVPVFVFLLVNHCIS